MTEPETPVEPSSEASPDSFPDEGFELLWNEVQDQWDDEKVHGAFLEYARASIMLPEAGARYRTIKEADPARAEVAERQLGRLLALAFTMLEAAREEPKSHSKWVTSLAYAVAAGFLALLIRKVLEGH